MHSILLEGGTTAEALLTTFIPMILLSLFCYIIPKGPIAVYGVGIKGIFNFFLDFIKSPLERGRGV